GHLFGFQLWLNLPAAEKMRDPWYADIPASEIPNIDLGNGSLAKLIAGEWNGTNGAGPERKIAPFFADVTVGANASVSVPLPQGHAGFVYVFEGEARVGSIAVGKGELGILSDG